MNSQEARAETEQLSPDGSWHEKYQPNLLYQNPAPSRGFLVQDQLSKKLMREPLSLGTKELPGKKRGEIYHDLNMKQTKLYSCWDVEVQVVGP